MMRPSTISYVFLSTFLAAIVALQWWQEPSYPSYCWILLGSVGCLGSFCSLFKKTHTASGVTLAVIFGLSLALLSVSRTTHVPTPDTIDTYAHGEEVVLHGIVADEPDKRPMMTKYTIEVNWIQTINRAPEKRLAVSDQRAESNRSPLIAGRSVHGRVLATDHRGYPDFFYGDEVIAIGRLERPGIIEDFSYDKYLSRYDIYSVINRASLTKRSSENANRLLAFLYQTKARFEAQINRIYPEPHASFLAGLLTGSRRGIPDHLLKDFNIVGLTHIIAISGYNITIVMTLITGLLFWLPLRFRLIPSIVAVVLFTLFVGASASVVRAAITGTLGLIAIQTGRRRDMRLAILWTACAMLLWNPKYLWYDASFQLSFLAVIGLNELSPLIEPYLKHIPHVLGIHESLQATLAAQLVAMPWIVVLFSRLSLISPVANILVAPLVPLAMLFGFLSTTVSFFWFFGGQMIAYIGWGLLELITMIAEKLSQIPFASLTIGSFSIVFVLLYYGMLLGVLFYIRCHRSSSHSR